MQLLVIFFLYILSKLSLECLKTHKERAMRNELCIAFSYLYMHIYEGIEDLISFLQLNFPSPTPEKKPLSFEGLEIVEVIIMNIIENPKQLF